jgi:hypothetical protein
MVKTFKFHDWSGQQIKVLLRKENDEWHCEINPHNDAWWPVGSAAKQQEALKMALDFWNEYDSTNGLHI